MKYCFYSSISINLYYKKEIISLWQPKYDTNNLDGKLSK